MKTHAPESRGKNTPKSASKQGQTDAEIGQLAKFIGFKPSQSLALELVAKTECQTIKEYTRSAIVALLRTSVNELETLANRGGPYSRQAEQVLTIARPELAPLLNELSAPAAPKS